MITCVTGKVTRCEVLWIIVQEVFIDVMNTHILKCDRFIITEEARVWSEPVRRKEDVAIPRS